MSPTLQNERTKAIGVIPNKIEQLDQAIVQLGLKDQPVIVLIGGQIPREYEDVTQQAIEVIAQTAEELDAVVLCGGTDMGIMAAIGQVRDHEQYQFPLIGIAPENLVTWPNRTKGNSSAQDEKREPLESHHSHFILVPGKKFGDESAWIVRAGTFISQPHHKSVTILANGGKVSQKDIEYGLRAGRPLIVLKGTGRLADEMAELPSKNELINIVPAKNKDKLKKTITLLLGQ